jgi:tRNA threonylcarbamoyladenosine biosynthesis protein TsaE
MLRPGDVVVLSGKLGSGKTVFVRGLAGGLKLDEQLVNSPSYTVVNEYPGDNPLYHFDLYRIGDESELYEIGWDDYISRKGLVVIEWGEKAKSCLPEKYYQINFKVLDETQREINISFINNE